MKQWILDRWLAYARTCLMLAVFLAPVIFWRGTVDVFNLVKMTVLLVAGSAALLFWISWSAESGHWMPRFKILIPALAFLLAGVISTLFSENPMLSITGLYHRYGGLIPFALYVGLMMLIAGMYWERPLALRDIAKASAAASVILTGYALIQAAGMDWIEWRDASGNTPAYPVSTMGNSNFAGGYLGIALPFLIYMAVSAKQEFIRYFLMVMVAADLLALWFTQTRGGMIAGGVGIATMVFFYRERLPHWVRRATAVLVILAVLLAFVVLVDPGGLAGPLIQLEVLRTGTFNIRTFYWGTAWRIFTDNPLVGTGLDTYFSNYPSYRLDEDGAALGLTITDKPHNIFLEYASNAGLLGAGTYLATVGLGLWFALRRVRHIDGPEKLLLATFSAVLAGYLAQGVFSIDVPPLAVMGWIALAGIVAIADPAAVLAREKLMAAAAEAKKRAKRQSKAMKRQAKQAAQGPLRWPVHVAGTVVVALLLFFGLRPLMADASAKDAEAIQRTEQGTEQALKKFEDAVRLHPLEPSYRVQIGAIAEAKAREAEDRTQKEEYIRTALKRFQEAYELQPGNVFYMMNLGRIYGAWGEIDVEKFELSDKWWRTAANHDPTDWEVHSRYALMLNSWANAKKGDSQIRRRAAAELQKVVKIKPESIETWINLAKIYAVLGEQAKAGESAAKALELDPKNKEAQQLLNSLNTQ